MEGCYDLARKKCLYIIVFNRVILKFFINLYINKKFYFEWVRNEEQ